MTIATFDYDETRVCEKCYTNDQIHFNLVLMHGSTHFHDDPDCAAWCNRCFADCNLMDEYEIPEKED